MNKFAQPVSMMVNEPQLISLIPKMEKLGYIILKSEYSIFGCCAVTNYSGISNIFTTLPTREPDRDLNRYPIKEYNEELFLALAAMRNEKEFYDGEYVFDLNERYLKLRGRITYITKIEQDKVWCMDVDESASYNYKEQFSEYYRKATFKEILDFFKQSPMKAEFVLPVKWAVGRNKDNYKEINNWANDHPNKFYAMTCDNGYIYLENDNCSCSGLHVPKEYTEITFEQFKKYVIKENKMTDKKIIGYKLIKPEYLVVAENIVNGPLKGKTFLVSANSTYSRKLIEAGVLDLWFEPVYNSSKKEFILGSQKCKVEIENGVITAQYLIWDKDQLRNIIQHHSEIFRMNKYDIKISRKTQCILFGCEDENNLFSLEELIQVYNEAQNK